jgi:thiosulfate reductase cytochrome b subunit
MRMPLVARPWRREGRRAAHEPAPPAGSVAARGEDVKPRTATRLAWGLWLFTMVLTGITVAFTGTHPLRGSTGDDGIVSLLVITTFPSVGSLIAARRPRNPIGWIFCAMGLLFVIAVFTGNYAEYALKVEPGSLRFGRQAAWVGNWIWLVALCPVALFLLLFPNGTLPSVRWRLVVRALAGGLAAWAVAFALKPGPLTNAGYENVDNPYGIRGLGAFFDIVGAVSGLVILTGALASVGSVVVRFRAATGVERNQLQWVAYAAALVGVFVVAGLVVEWWAEPEDVILSLVQQGLVVSMTGIPIAAAIAILRHRLYDIDRIINRTLVYGLLSALLGAAYASIVAVAGSVAPGTEITTAGATLAVAALFRPLRRRVQDFIDKRFYRRRYDAAQTLEAFGARVRDEVDLDALTGELLAVVRTTVQPAHASLWLRGEVEENTRSTLTLGTL